MRLAPRPGSDARAEGPAIGRAAVFLPLVCALTFVVLVASVEPQISDTNFYSLWEATALLHGDHPYRDFFEWGIPLQAAVSALAQVTLGPRLLSEFIVQWLGIVTGVGVAFAIARRVSSAPAAFATILLALPSVAATPTYHYPKLLFYPLAIWAGWRYFDVPTRGRGAIVGALTAAAFLYRHDHGIYAGLAAVFVFVTTGLAGREPGGWRRLGSHALAYVGAAVLCLLPWAVLVQSGEGLPEYLTRRLAFYVDVTPPSAQFLGPGSPFRRLLTTNPFAAVVAPSTFDGAPALQQLALALPVLLLGLIAMDARTRPGPGSRLDRRAWLTLPAALFLLVVDIQLFREPGYALLVYPMTMALGSQLLVRGGRWRAAFSAMLLLGVLNVYGMVRGTPLTRPWELVTERAPRALAQLLATPPLDAFMSREAAEAMLAVTGGDAWNLGTLSEGRHPLLRYLHDCTSPEDRVWVSGSTPFHVGYLIDRRIAGGHLYWHQAWRRDPEGQAVSLRLLRSTSVPFFFSANDPVLDELVPYPQIREHVLGHYDEVPGTAGHLFVERGRMPTSTFGPARFPCFGTGR